MMTTSSTSFMKLTLSHKAWVEKLTVESHLFNSIQIKKLNWIEKHLDQMLSLLQGAEWSRWFSFSRQSAS